MSFPQGPASRVSQFLVAMQSKGKLQLAGDSYLPFR